MLTPLAVALGVLGAGWGFAADRIGARWPEHEDGSVRRLDWRTIVAVVAGALVLGGLTVRYPDPGPALIFGAYLAALVLLLATDLDQRLLPAVVTYPAIPAAFAVDLLGLNPLVAPADLPWAIVAAIAIPAFLALVAIPFGAGAIGRGDLTLLLSVGLMVGAYRMVTGVVWGVLVAGLVILLLLVARRITLKTFVPFGPFLIAGAAWAILVIR